MAPGTVTKDPLVDMHRHATTHAGLLVRLAPSGGASRVRENVELSLISDGVWSVGAGVTLRRASSEAH